MGNIQERKDFCDINQSSSNDDEIDKDDQSEDEGPADELCSADVQAPSATVFDGEFADDAALMKAMGLPLCFNKGDKYTHGKKKVNMLNS